MKAWFASIPFLLAGLAWSCGGDSSGTGSAAGGTSSGGSAGAGGSSASGGSSSGGSSASGGAAGGGGSAGGGTSTQCGPSQVCAPYSVCMVDEIAPECTPKLDDAGSCPPGQTETLCGGIGTPCCCDPAPPPGYRCEGKGICGATPDCTCLGDICNNGQMCIGIGGKAWEFHCVDPPVP